MEWRNGRRYLVTVVRLCKSVMDIGSIMGMGCFFSWIVSFLAAPAPLVTTVVKNTPFFYYSMPRYCHQFS